MGPRPSVRTRYPICSLQLLTRVFRFGRSVYIGTEKNIMSTKAQNETAGEEIQLDELAGVAGGLAGRPGLIGSQMTVQPGATRPSQVKGGGLMGAAMRAGSAAHLRGKALGAFEKAFV